jgi:hypothetical protein
MPSRIIEHFGIALEGEGNHAVPALTGGDSGDSPVPMGPPDNGGEMCLLNSSQGTLHTRIRETVVDWEKD